MVPDLQGREAPEPAPDVDGTQLLLDDGHSAGAEEAGGQLGRRLHGHRPDLPGLPRPTQPPLHDRNVPHPDRHRVLQAQPGKIPHLGLHRSRCQVPTYTLKKLNETRQLKENKQKESKISSKFSKKLKQKWQNLKIRQL